MILPNQPQQFNKQKREKRTNPMKRTIERLTRAAMLAVAFMLCATGQAWAVNIDGSLNYAVTSSGSSLSVVVDDRVWHNATDGGTWGASVMDDVSEARICITPSDILPSGTKVNVSSLEFGLNSTGDSGKHSSTITINSVTSQNKVGGGYYSSSVVLNSSGGGQGVSLTYSFSGLTLEVGKSYAITFSNDATERKFMCVTSANGATIFSGFKSSSAEKNVMFKLTGTISYSPEAASVSSNVTWGEGSLDGFLSDDASGAYKINVTDDATITIPASTTAAYLTLNVSAGKTATLSSTGFNAAAIFIEGGSGAKAILDGTISTANTFIYIPTTFPPSVDYGKITVGGSGEFVLDATTQTVTADENLKALLTTGAGKMSVNGADNNGLSASWNANTEFTTHTTFDGGTHNLTVLGQTSPHTFCENSSNSDPLWRVKDDTVLNLTAKDLGGWSGRAKAQVTVIAVDNGGQLNLKDNGSNTFYYEGRFLLEPNSTLDVQTASDRLRLNGGVASGYEQIYVPDQISDTSATPAVVSGSGTVNAYDNGFGVYVGENAKLDWSAPINRNAGNILKSGAGTWKIIGRDLGIPVTGSEGTIELSANKIYNKISVAQEFSGKLKLVAPTTDKYWWGFTDLSSAQHLPGRPELELDMSTQFLYLADGYNNGAYPLTVKNLSGSAKVTSSWGGSSAGNKIIDSLQTDNTTFSGTFTGDDNDATALTVRGADSASTIYGLTLSGESDTRGPLTITNNAKVVFSPSGKWSSGTVTVCKDGVLESQNSSAAIAANLKVEEGATLKFANGVSLSATAYDWTSVSNEESVNIDLSDVTPTSTTITLLPANAGLTDGDLSKLTVSAAQRTPTLSVESGALKATFPNFWRNGTWGGSVVPGDDATLYISEDSTLTVSEALSLGAVTVVKEGEGDVTLTISGAGALTTGGWTIPEGVTINTPTTMSISGTISGDGVLNIPANTTLAMDDVTCTTKVTVSGTLETSGTTTLSGANTSAERSLIEVVDGTTTLSTAFKGINGNLTIDSTATLVFGESLNGDGVNQYYDNVNPAGNTVIDVYGTLNTGDFNDLEFGAGITLNLRANSRIDAVRTSSYGDLAWTGNGNVHVYGDSTVAVKIRTATNISPVFTVDEAAILTITSPFISQSYTSASAGGSLTKAGGGTLDLTAITPTKPITINAGTVVADEVPTANMTINANGTFTLKDVNWASGDWFSGAGTLELKETRSETKRVASVASTFPGILKMSSYDENGYYAITGVFSGEPELVIGAPYTGSAGFALGSAYDNGAFEVRNFAGVGKIRGNYDASTAEATRTIRTKQTKDTEFSGIFQYYGTAPRKYTALTVYGEAATGTHSLTLSGASETTKDLTIEEYGKVIFSGSGSWLHGTTTVKANGVLESQRNAKVVGALTLEAGSTLSFADGYSLQVGSVAFPASGYVNVDAHAVTLSAEGITIMTFTSAPSSISALSCDHAVLELDGTSLKAYPAVASVTFADGSAVSYATLGAAQSAATANSNSYKYITILSDMSFAPGLYRYKIKDGVNATPLPLSDEYLTPTANDPDVETGAFTYNSYDAKATSYTWSGAETTKAWMLPNNWTYGASVIAQRAPTTVDSVRINSDTTQAAIIVGDVTVHDMSIGNTVKMTASSAKTLTVADGVVLTSSSATLEIAGSLSLDATVTTSVAGKCVKWVDDGSSITYSVVDPVAQIGEVEYGSLTNAIEKAVNGNTITLLANCAEAVDLGGRSITFVEGAEATFTGSFTGTGTLAFQAGSLLKSAANSTLWASGWTGTVWIKNKDNITGSTFNPNNYGCEGSTVKFSGVKGWIDGNTTGFTIKPTIEVDNDEYGYGLWLSNGNGYNGTGGIKNYTVLNGLKGSGILMGSDSGANALLLVKEWGDFSGTLTLTNKVVVFGEVLPEQTHIEGGGYVVVGSGKSVTVPAGKTWTLGNGVIVDGNLSLGTGASIVNTTPAETWLKRGAGTVTLNSFSDLPAKPAADWRGTVALPQFFTAGPLNLNIYGVAGSTVELAGMSVGWLKVGETTVIPNLKLTGAFAPSSMSTTGYSFNEISGFGQIVIPNSGSPTSINIAKITTGYTGAITNNSSTAVTITELALASEHPVTAGTKLLTIGGTGGFRIDSVTVGGVAQTGLPLTYASDGVYVTTVATVADVPYAFLADALAIDNATIVLNQDISGDITLKPGQTLELNGHTVSGTVSGAAGDVTEGIELATPYGASYGYICIDNRVRTWIGTSGSAWRGFNVWDNPYTYPGTYTEVRIPSFSGDAVTGSIVLSGNESVKSITLGAGVALTLTAASEKKPTLTVTETIYLTSGQTITLGEDVALEATLDTNDSRSRVVFDESAKTYSVQVIPGTIFSVY